MPGKRTALIAALLAAVLLLFVGPAAVAGPSEKTPDQTLNDHPSGKDRTDKPAEDKTQGKSTSDPDGDANGGPDKPGAAGGFDADQDGNNGCGNDDDFEDDNNGWCGKPPSAEVESDAAVQSNTKVKDTTGDVASGETAAQVMGVTFVRSLATTEAASAAPASASVLSATTTAAAPAGTLAATGRSLAMVAALGLLLVAAGTVLVLAEERRRLMPVRVRVRR